MVDRSAEVAVTSRRRFVSLVLVAACSPAAEGLRATPPGDGPMVVVDWDRRPIAEVPFPNDLATRSDATSPTGLRLNLATEADTAYDSKTRTKFNELTGFGVYQAITVSFDAGLDVQNLIDRHPNDFHLPDAFADDAILLVDVDPDSPEYGQTKALDLGHGRYPYDVFDVNRYFANDPRAGQPALLWETFDEDANADGVLQPREDSDGDGLLDFPNVWPEGGDPFEDLLTFYDRQSYQLVLRPVVPLRENTTYAVVLTDRVIDEAGAPIRSPWPFVHHTRQTSALAPLAEILPTIDPELDLDHVAFAWTYTTNTPTKDLRDLRAALFDGAGPYGRLQAHYPAGFVEALAAGDAAEEAWQVDASRIATVLAAAGVVGEGEGAELILAAIAQFTDRIVGATIEVPYLLTDLDDEGTDDSDEWWRIDPATGRLVHAPQRVPMLCAIPKAQNGFAPPFDVFVYGHGYGSNRLESLLFSAVLNRFGFAVCGIDAPGHGATIDAEQQELVDLLLEAQGLKQLGRALFDSRVRDLDNNGSPDSGGDQWSADAFHTRDMVRQQVVDWMQLARAFRACGTGSMVLATYDETGTPVRGTETRTACDWDGDGAADLAGPDAKLVLAGGSLGGISVGVAAAVLPEFEAFATVVPGGGIADVGIRTDIGGAVEAFIGRFVGPLFVGLPDGAGGIRVAQLVNSVTDMIELPIGTLATWPTDGFVRLTNLNKGEEAVVPMPADGRFRVAVATDGLDPGEKRLLVGMPPTGPEEGVTYVVEDTVQLGDAMLLEILDADGGVVATFDRWATDVVHEGVTMPAGSPVVAGSHGNGKLRGSVEARRLAFLAAMVLEPGDPIAYARHWFEDPFPEQGPSKVLIMPTVGDNLVAINTGIAAARAAGLVDWQNIDPRYGTTVDQWLIDRQVIRGIEERGPWRCADELPCLFDPDDLDNGADLTGAPSDAPLRSTRTLDDGSVVGLRIPYVSKNGSHGFSIPDPTLPYDMTAFALNQLAVYVTSGGTVLDDRPCLGAFNCPEFPPFDFVEEEAP